MAKLIGFFLLTILANLSWAYVTTTESPFEDTTPEAVVSENEDDDSTQLPELGGRHGSGFNWWEETVEEVKPVENPTCTEPGIQADDSNCQLYHECTTLGSADGALHLVTKSCPEREAFNYEVNRCSRDISSCHPKVQCFSKGVIADPDSNSSYYLCQPHFSGYGFHIFHVYCGKNELFYPTLGICSSDLNDLFTNGFTVFSDPLDIINVKREIIQLKKDYKLQIKKEKEQRKAAKKLQKQIEKEAEQQRKLQTQIRKLEAANFKCETEGNFPSKIADNFYLACINLNENISAIALECSLGAKFVSETGTCEKNE